MTDEAILDRILSHEGGFVNHPLDAGKATNYGITLATLSEWRGKPVTVDDVRSMDVEEARAIYRNRYIRPFDAMALPPELKAQVVDIAVNSGVTTARGLLSRAQQQTARPVAVQLVIERLRFYARIVKGKPTQSVFIEGWINRAVSFL
jgi:lysozyme family protein